MTDRLSLAMAELVEALREALRDEAAAALRTPDRLLDVDEAATLLSLGRTSVYGELAAGRLRSIRIGRRRLIPGDAVRSYIADRQDAA
jgi:excisionase family DNA binding protein